MGFSTAVLLLALAHAVVGVRRHQGHLVLSGPHPQVPGAGAHEGQQGHGTHRRAHHGGLVGVQVASDADQPRGADGLGGAQDGAEISRIAALVKADPESCRVSGQGIKREIALLDCGDHGLAIAFAS